MREIIHKERERLLKRLQTIREFDNTEDFEKEIEEIEARLNELSKLEENLESEKVTETTEEKEKKEVKVVTNSTVFTELAGKLRVAGRQENLNVHVVKNAVGNSGAAISPGAGSDAANVFCRKVDGINIEDWFTVAYRDKAVRYTTWQFTDAGTTECGGLKKQMVGTPQSIENNFTKFAGYITVDECLIEDDKEFEQGVSEEVANGVARERLKQILSGDGEGANLTGIVNTDGVGNITHSANWVEEIATAIAQVQTATGERADGLLVSPDVWQEIVTARTSDSLMFPLAVTQGVESVTPWGLKMGVTSALPAGTAVVGAFKTVKVDLRKAIEVGAGYTDDNFIYDLITIRGYQRGGVAVTCPQSIVVIK